LYILTQDMAISDMPIGSMFTFPIVLIQFIFYFISKQSALTATTQLFLSSISSILCVQIYRKLERTKWTITSNSP